MNSTDMNNTLFTRRTVLMMIVFSIIYLLLTSFLVGLNIEHWLIVIIYNLCFFSSRKSKKFILAFTIFVVFGILYNFMKAFPNYLVNKVDISPLYYFEKQVFGITVHHQRLTPCEFFATCHNTFFDILSGFFYINWIPVPLAFAFYLYLRNKEQFLHFSLTFFFVNLIGFCIYYLHPAAPPWYVNQYGFQLNLGAPGSNAGLARFDALLHIPVFESIYSRNSNIFAALPSLHSAYPVVVLYYAIKNKLGRINWLLGVFMAGIWFSAVYSGHHYVTDVISGIVCAGVGIILFQKVLLKIPFFSKWTDNYKSSIS